MTNFNPEIHHRRTMRLQNYDYSQSGMYFVTICTHERGCLFGEIDNGKIILNEYGKIVENEIINTENIRNNVCIDPYIIMPDHIHIIICIEFRRGDLPVALNTTDNSFQMKKGDRQVAPTIKQQTIGSIISGLKSTITTQINIRRNSPRNPVWQRNYYEHIIRDEYDYQRCVEYILSNPYE